MGMFDYVRCERPLPDGWSLAGDALGLQTKDFDCEMTTYTIGADGRLMVERNEWEATPDGELPYPDMPLIGSIRSKRRWLVDTNYHGRLYFYGLETIGHKEPDGRGWRQPLYRSHDYVAKFTDGDLVGLFATDEDGSQAPPASDGEGFSEGEMPTEPKDSDHPSPSSPTDCQTSGGGK